MEATLVRRNRLAGALSALGFGSALALTLLWMAGLVHARDMESFIGNVLFYSLIPTAIWFRYYGAKRSVGTIETAVGALRAKDDRGEVSIAARSGRIARLRDGGWRVDVKKNWLRGFRVEVGSEAQARDILRGLGLDRREGTTRFRVRRAGLEAMLPFVASTITVGVDGIDVSGFGRKRFIPHAQIRLVRRTAPTPPIVVSPGVELELVDGSVLKLDTRKERFDAENWENDPVYDAIWRARSKLGGEASASAMLQRGQRSTAEWMQAIRAVAEGKANYRVASIDDQSLESVITDASAPVDARAAAALALRVKDPARLRIAIEDVADEDVRRVALADDADVEKHLAALITPR